MATQSTKDGMEHVWCRDVSVLNKSRGVSYIDTTPSYTVCAAVGRNHLYEIFENFLALMGYWVSIWVVITLQEQLLFRKSIYNWEDWNDPQKLPIGVAALGAFLIGWAGAVISMDQVYFIGPVASMVGDYGADMGIFVGASWAFLVFPPFRWMEKRLVGR